MSYFNPALLSKLGHTVVMFGEKRDSQVNTALCELVTAVRKFEQTHKSASAPTPDCPSTGVGADTYLNKETK